MKQKEKHGKNCIFDASGGSRNEGRSLYERGGREYKELLGLVVQLREKLEAGLDEAQKELLKKYDDALMKMNLLGEKEAYAAGVKFAMKLAMKTMN